jgi:hypothetical protein
MKNRNASTHLLLALLLLASCGETTAPVEEYSEHAIGFTPYTMPDDPFRSAGELSDASLNTMTVFAYTTGTSNFDAVASTSTPDFMYNQAVIKDGSAWTYSPQKYWPVQGHHVSFFALAPATADGVELLTTKQTTDYPAFRITASTNPAEQVDFCVAAAMDASYTAPDGQVALHFAHTMAKMTFSAKYVSDETFGVVIGKIEISGLKLHNSNTLRFTSSSFTWDNLPSDAPAVETGYTLSVVDKTLKSTPLEKTTALPLSTDAGTLMLIPQTIPAGATIKVTLWVWGEAVERQGTMPELTLKEGQSYNYSLTMNDTNNDMFGVLGETKWEYEYTAPGDFQTFVAPKERRYKLEAWGASGTNETDASYGGRGAYATGEINLKQGQLLCIYTGESTSERRQSFNGGATGKGGTGASGTGGGATDIRLVPGAWNDAASLNSRILVAGGGGGGGRDPGYSSVYARGGAGGGLTGYDGAIVDNATNKVGGKGGGQTSGGAGVSSGTHTSSTASWGMGSDGASNTNVAGGGGGYYGGSGGARTDQAYGAAGGGGGSSFISSMTGCEAIDPTDIVHDPRTKANSTMLIHINSAFGPSPTWGDGDAITFTSPTMIDGATTMTTPSGGTATGHSGNGFVRITQLAD